MVPQPQITADAADRRYELIDNSAFDWHIRTRAGLPFELRFCREGYPRHHFATREAALDAAARWVAYGEHGSAVRS